jgi:hypothetical protein
MALRRACAAVLPGSDRWSYPARGRCSKPSHGCSRTFASGTRAPSSAAVTRSMKPPSPARLWRAHCSRGHLKSGEARTPAGPQPQRDDPFPCRAATGRATPRLPSPCRCAWASCMPAKWRRSLAPARKAAEEPPARRSLRPSSSAVAHAATQAALAVCQPRLDQPRLPGTQGFEPSRAWHMRVLVNLLDPLISPHAKHGSQQLD